MSVVAWDGKTLAADQQETSGTTKFKCRKIFRLKTGELVADVGNSARGAEIRAWYADGALPKAFRHVEPRDDDGIAVVIVIHPSGEVWQYENTPYPTRCRQRRMAWGCGREIALAGMKLGLDAKAAVRLTCELDAMCGMGVDTLTFQKSRAKAKPKRG